MKSSSLTPPSGSPDPHREAGRPGTHGAVQDATPVCAVVLVAWNNRSYLMPCLQSLFTSGMRNAIEVVVVDNGSTDGTQDVLRQEFPEVVLVQNDSNLGLGTASNQGIAATTAPFVLLLNNDTIVNGASLDRLIDFMSATPDAGAVGGTLLNADGTFQSGYNHFPTLVEEFLNVTGLGAALWPGYPSSPGAVNDPSAVDWITSACLLLRRSALDHVGLLNESYFIYGDETDLQYRLAREGWRVYLIPDATTIHFGGRSLDRWRRRRLVYRGKMLFYRNHYGAIRTAALRAVIGAVTAGKVAVWGLVWPVPTLRIRASRELSSNAEVLRLCWKLE